MTSGKTNSNGSKLRRAQRTLITYFNLRDGKADDDAIDETIRAGVALKGTNLWVLIFAILIAAIGLNVNSTAVIIGAMLISPLMGPIMGVGYGIGVYDFALIKRSLKHLGLAILLSLIASTVYFLLTPLSGAQSELLARTTPNLWDVLIALFGGLAGMVGATRKEKSNVIPGVAIATALMPPLCTAGYGLANGNWTFFFGAAYLFSINCVFIAVSAVIITWVIHSPRQRSVDKHIEIRVRRAMLAVVLLTALPSIFLAYRLVQDEVFNAKALQFVQQELRLKQTHIAETKVMPTQRVIEVTLIGERVDERKLSDIVARLPAHGLSGTELVVHQTTDQQIDASLLKASIVNDLYRDSRRELEDKDKTIQNLQQALQNVEIDRDRLTQAARELHAQYPQIRKVLLSDAAEWDAESGAVAEQRVTVLNVTARARLRPVEKRSIERWLKVRLNSDHVRVVVN
jgi:uncharacterized hydrophobic protein (TIGR00271 family)